mgnify:FL=1
MARPQGAPRFAAGHSGKKALRTAECRLGKRIFMELDLSCFRPAERAQLELRAVYEKAGYHKYHMGGFEEYSLYQENRGFLSSDQVITFTDLDGRLLAMKPDVTLGIAKNAQPAPGECKKYYYVEKVYRPSRESRTFKEINQMGLECIGAVDDGVTAQVVQLAVQSLAAAGVPYVLEIGHMGFIKGLLDAVDAPRACRAQLLGFLQSKNAHELQQAALQAGISAWGAQALCGLLELNGPLDNTLCRAREMVKSEGMSAALDEVSALLKVLGGTGSGLRLDLSLGGEMEYYNGLVFNGYLQGLPRAVVRGGRYDLLARRFTHGAGAIGFAVYLDELERLQAARSAPLTGEKTMLNVALPKGRLGDKVYGLLAGAGYGCAENYNETRKLVVENPEAGIRYFLVKPSDVAIYVEHGAADIGIVGKDILAESGADVYELLDTGLGRCRMCVAGPENFIEDESRSLRVATKFVNIAKRYYAGQGRDIDIIRLNGSIELAPILGLSDVIVDIVETGATLRENDLTVLKEFMPISARCIANKASSKFKEKELQTLLQKLREAVTK